LLFFNRSALLIELPTNFSIFTIFIDSTSTAKTNI
jgi:hypothetical protein